MGLFWSEFCVGCGWCRLVQCGLFRRTLVKTGLFLFLRISLCSLLGLLSAVWVSQQYFYFRCTWSVQLFSDCFSVAHIYEMISVSSQNLNLLQRCSSSKHIMDCKTSHLCSFIFTFFLFFFISFYSMYYWVTLSSLWRTRWLHNHLYKFLVKLYIKSDESCCFCSINCQCTRLL